MLNRAFQVHTYALLVLTSLFALTACTWEKVKVENDMEIPVALVRCEGKSVVSDEVYLDPHESKVVSIGKKCPVTGPTRKSSIGLTDNGAYLGCLLTPDGNAGREKHALRTSVLNTTMSFSECDGVK